MFITCFYVTIQRIAESTPPLLMERVGERRNKQAKSHFYSPSPYPLPPERDVVLRAE
jgi:hypothetical protein